MISKPGCRYWTNQEKVSAEFDPSGTYRYQLTCSWNKEKGSVTFIMLNPSYADLKVCDRTLNRCVDFTKSWGYGGMKIVNLFALISTDPNLLKSHSSPVGENNNDYILGAVEQSDLLVFAWGEKHCTIQNRSSETIELLRNFNPKCIKKTISGNHPRHPLYLKKELEPIPYF
ncbi:DUF1643 domain-containing protein [Anaerobacillus sp. 1_MG-2023]|uniref:DUF1643 domain-containing protein n=1 Tax=Anaerobacillus sp. 1_MG-2023 TaxID=3062655 RepID=UPI0026E2D0E6|nr:DUF1643 domain-containing protein [Anaerobacillus sp. 1_MG-2023]MDO6658111.1 DUF1643 domain-containing protein [Anaerobacillus sp. 1_MG-2023]